MTLTEKAKETAGRLVSLFDEPDVIRRYVCPALIRAEPPRPADSWSLSNRLLVIAGGTDDARGFRQWKEVGRRVRKGAKALYILAPIHVRRTEADAETGADVEDAILVGFRCVPVFRVEETDGDPLPTYTPAKPPPLADVARAWGIGVEYGPFTATALGRYSPAQRRIRLHTHDAMTFFHELAHAAQDRLGMLVAGQDPRQEAVAEFSAAVLAVLYGGEEKDAASVARRYIAASHLDPARAVTRFIAEVEKVLDAILGEATRLGERKAA